MALVRKRGKWGKTHAVGGSAGGFSWTACNRSFALKVGLWEVVEGGEPECRQCRRATGLMPTIAEQNRREREAERARLERGVTRLVELLGDKKMTRYELAAAGWRVDERELRFGKETGAIEWGIDRSKVTPETPFGVIVFYVKGSSGK